MTPTGNGEVELGVPALGRIRIAGRDLLLAITLLILGAGAVAVQAFTFHAFSESLRADVKRAERDRTRMLSLLQLRTCTTEYLEAARAAYPPGARQDVARLWGEVCLGASQGGPPP